MMRRWSRVVAGAAAAWALTAGSAFGLDLLPGGSSGPGPSTVYTWQQINQMGKLNAHNGRLLPGCHMYPWTYSIHPPKGMNWEVDVYISGPRGKQLAADAIIMGGDPLSGTKYYKLCTQTAPKGTYTILAEMSLWGDTYQHAHLPIVHYTLN
jgi:hypothetical protein